MPSIWPVTLQTNVNRDSFSKAKGKTTITSTNDVGPVKVRRRTTRPRDTYTVSIWATKDQVATFETFYDTTINGGAGTFYFLDPISKVNAVWRMTNEPNISPVGYDTYNITMAWEKLFNV